MQPSKAVLSVLFLSVAAAGCRNLPAQKAAVPSASQTAAMAERAAMDQGGPKKVNVIAKCDTMGATKITIAPWRVEAYQGDTITWDVTPPAPNGPDSIEVTAKNSNLWPFPELSYSSGSSSELTATLDTVPTGTYHYTLRVFCGQKVIVIDPDIMVSRKH